MDEVAEFFETKDISEEAREIIGGHYMLWALYDNLINGNYPVPVTWEILRFMVRESFVSAAEKAAEETANYFCRSFDRRTLGVADAPRAIRSNNSWDSVFYSVLESAIDASRHIRTHSLNGMKYHGSAGQCSSNPFQITDVPLFQKKEREFFFKKIIKTV